jgi:hypothetical protein
LRGGVSGGAAVEQASGVDAHALPGVAGDVHVAQVGADGVVQACAGRSRIRYKKKTKNVARVGFSAGARCWGDKVHIFWNKTSVKLGAPAIPMAEGDWRWRSGPPPPTKDKGDRGGEIDHRIKLMMSAMSVAKPASSLGRAVGKLAGRRPHNRPFMGRARRPRRQNFGGAGFELNFRLLASRGA